MRVSYEGEPIRIKIEAILIKHSDKTPNVLAAMIVGYLAADDVISVGNGGLDNDPRYNNNSKDFIYAEESQETLDYLSIGLDLLF